MQDEATPFPELLTEAELLRPLGGAWVDRAHAYLSTGQPGSILDDLAAIAGDSPVADLLHVSRHSLHEELRRPWVASIEDPDVLLRLARFWTAAVVPGERPRHPFLPDWCAMLLVSSSTPYDRPDLDGELRPGLPASRVARALDAGGEHAEGLVRALLCQDVAAEWPLHPTWFAEFEDWSFLAEHTRLVHSLLARSSAEVTRSRLQVLSWTDADLGPLLNVLVHLACDRPATVRDVARRALWRRWQDTLPILCELATLERPSTRFEALWLIGQHHREAARPFLELRRAEETDARAKAIIALLLEPGVPVVTKVRETVRSEPPQRKRLAAPPAVTPEQRHLLEQLPRARGSWTRAALDELCASLCDPSPWRSRPKRLLRNQSFDNGRIVACVRSGRWSPIPLLRLLHHASCLPEAEPPFDFFDELQLLCGVGTKRAARRDRIQRRHRHSQQIGILSPGARTLELLTAHAALVPPGANRIKRARNRRQGGRAARGPRGRKPDGVAPVGSPDRRIASRGVTGSTSQVRVGGAPPARKEVACSSRLDGARRASRTS